MALASDMASALMLTIILFIFSFQSTCSNDAEAYRNLAKGQLPKRQKGYGLDLIRRDSPLSPLSQGKNLTISQRLRASIKRSNARLQKLQSRVKGSLDNFYSPLSAFGFEYIAEIGIGFPVPLRQHVAVDTGSGLLWVKCEPCRNNCISEVDTIFNPQQSISYSNVSCRSSACADVPGQCDKDKRSCNYTYDYADGSYLEGVLAREIISLATLFPPSLVFVPDIVLGCAYYQEKFNNIAGLIGMGRDRTSLISQLGSSIDYKFSYCFESWDSPTGLGSLLMGDLAVLHGRNVKTTPLIRSKYLSPFYCVKLEGISVAGKAVLYPRNSFVLQEKARKGGFIVDSDTSFTNLVSGAYTAFRAAVRSSIDLHPVHSKVLDLCYDANTTKMGDLPTVTFKFAGNATFELPPMSNFIKVEDDNGHHQFCLAYNDAGPVEESGRFSILGSIQQQNHKIGYDLRRNTFSFVPADCGKHSIRM